MPLTTKKWLIYVVVDQPSLKRAPKSGAAHLITLMQVISLTWWIQREDAYHHLILHAYQATCSGLEHNLKPTVSMVHLFLSSISLQCLMLIWDAEGSAVNKFATEQPVCWYTEKKSAMLYWCALIRMLTTIRFRWSKETTPSTSYLQLDKILQVWESTTTIGLEMIVPDMSMSLWHYIYHLKHN